MQQAEMMTLRVNDESDKNKVISSYMVNISMDPSYGLLLLVLCLIFESQHLHQTQMQSLTEVDCHYSTTCAVLTAFHQW